MEKYEKYYTNLEERNKSIINLLVYYGMTYVGVIIISFILLTILPGLASEVEAGSIDRYSAYLNFFVYLIIFVSLYFINKDRLLDDLDTFTYSKKTYLKMVLVGLLSVFAANIFLSSLYNILGIGQSINQENVTTAVLSSKFLSFFFVVIFGPFAEEIIFRYSLINLFSRLFKKTSMTSEKKLHLANLMSSFLFGLIHVISGGDFIFLPLYMILGFMIGLFYIKSKNNLAVAIFIHMAYNGLSYLLMVGM